MALLRFDTPGRVRDVPEGSTFYDDWHRTVERLGATSTAVSGSGRYVDPSRHHVDVVARRLCTWTGFPRPLLVEHPEARITKCIEKVTRGLLAVRPPVADGG